MSPGLPSPEGRPAELRRILQHARRNSGVGYLAPEMIYGDAAIGALIGAPFGHGQGGAAIGAGVSAAAGAGGEVMTKGKEVRVPTETVLNFKLDRGLSLNPVG